MKNLIIIRHAKSSWIAPLHDKSRALASRGEEDAALVSKNILQYLPKSYIMMSSTAKRAAKTAKIFAKNISYPEERIIYKDELYTFDVKQLEKVVKSLNDDYKNVILFGHNEAITNFVNKFGDIYLENIPTSGFVSINFDVDNWEIIAKGKIQKVLFPRDLKL